jgi:hypothetical protein
MVLVTSIVARNFIDICDESFYLHRQTTHQTASTACSTLASPSAIPARLKHNPA